MTLRLIADIDDFNWSHGSGQADVLVACGDVCDQAEVSDMLAGFPPVDVFIAHNSPRGVHDRDDEIHTGFDALTVTTDGPPALQGDESAGGAATCTLRPRSGPRAVTGRGRP